MPLCVKDEVLLKVNMEMEIMLDLLNAHFNKPEFAAGLHEFKKFDTYIKERLADYSPGPNVMAEDRDGEWKT